MQWIGLRMHMRSPVACPCASPCRVRRAVLESRGQAHPCDHPPLLDPTPHVVVAAILPEPRVNVNAPLVSHAHESDAAARAAAGDVCEAGAAAGSGAGGPP